MKLAVFGATGRTGRLLVEKALDEGHEVVASVRDRQKLGMEHERLAVVEGDARDPERVEEAVRGSDAVLSALGHTRGSERDVQTVATKRMVEAMDRHGVRRLVSLTGAGVSDPHDRPKLSDRVIAGLLNLLQKDVLEDARGHAEVIRESGLDWTIVRAPRLTGGPSTGGYRVGYVGLESGIKVSRADVAEFMLVAAVEGARLHESPMVSS